MSNPPQLRRRRKPVRIVRHIPNNTQSSSSSSSNDGNFHPQGCLVFFIMFFKMFDW